MVNIQLLIMVNYYFWRYINDLFDNLTSNLKFLADHTSLISVVSFFIPFSNGDKLIYLSLN